MIIIGCDYHPGFQQIAYVDTETGELQERRLQHREEAENFYRGLLFPGDDCADDRNPVALCSQCVADRFSRDCGARNEISKVAGAPRRVCSPGLHQ